MSELSLTDTGLDEEVARAEIYGLLAQLYLAPPSPELLASLRLAVTEAPTSGAFLEEPWRQVVGAARARGDAETEDHIAYLCEVMRYLIAGDDVVVANLTQQQRFFASHLQPWVERLCDDLAAHPAAIFYGALSGFTRAFMSVEAQGFDMAG